MSTWTITRERIPETRVSGKRLGRHYEFDTRSLAYPFVPAAGIGVQSVTHERFTPIMSQGDVGSCTGNAETGLLGTDPVYGTLPEGHPVLDEAEALALYSAAEVIDGDGPYPPQDNGSTGPSVMKAAVKAGLLSGYTHCFTLDAMLAALRQYPVIVGSNWYTSMDDPDPSGLVKVGGTVRGGHEYLCRQADVPNELLWFDNSWGLSYGVQGRFCYSFADASRLLSEGGDCTVPVPLNLPAPVPVPVTHPDVAFGHDPQMLAWAAGEHAGANAYASRAYTAWRAERGYH